MNDPRRWAQHVAAWRREVHDLYAAVRAEADPATAHASWVAGRTRMFDSHPASARQPGQGSQDDGWVLDLNFAYNPSCAYDPAGACPLAPAGNRITAEVPVGELITEETS